MPQPCEVASNILDEMMNINNAWYTREDHVSSLNFRIA